MATTSQWHSAAEYSRLGRLFDTQIRQCPNKISEILVDLHEDHRGHARYIYVDTILAIVLGTDNEAVYSPATMSMFRTMCTTRLPTTLLNILLDSRVYMWDETSEFYHPGLLVSEVVPYERCKLLTRIFSNTPKPLVNFLRDVAVT